MISTKFELEKLRAQVEREQKENQNKDYVLRDHADLVKANQQLDERAYAVKSVLFVKGQACGRSYCITACEQVCFENQAYPKPRV